MLSQDDCFVFRNQLQVTGSVKHLTTSTAEGYPTLIRVIMPNFIASNNDFVSNYETPNNATVNDIPGTTSAFDLVFNDGFTFPDYVEFNLTFTVDPDEKRLPGSGTTEAAIAFQPICKIIELLDEATGDVVQPCGKMVSIPISVNAPGRCVYERINRYI